MAMRLWINGTELTNFILSTPFKDTLDEELDNLNFQIKSTTRLTYKKFDKLMYWIGQGSTVVLNKKMAIFNIVETWEGEKWTYQISCLSPTKILESIIINGMADTYASASLLTQIHRVKEKINAQLSYEMATPITLTVNIDQSVINTSIKPSDFLWDGQVNVREIFNDMLDKVDMLCIGTDFTIDANNNITGITIEAVAREKNGSQILTSINDVENGGLEDVKQVVKGITYNRDSEYACGNIISLIKNGIAKDNVQQPYLPARNTDLTIDDSADWHILTQEPIYSLNKVEALLPIKLNSLWYWDTASTYKNYFIDFPNANLYICIPTDITEYIVEKNVFDAMSIKEQSKHLYFKRGEKGIYGLYKLYKTNPLTSQLALFKINAEAPRIPTTDSEVWNWVNCSDAPFLVGTSENYSNHTAPTTLLPFNVSRDGTKHIGDIKSYGGTIATNSDYYKNILFSVNYQPYCDSVVKIEKTNIASLEANTKNLSVIKNQSDRTIDMSKYYDSQQALIDRMGNKEMYIDAMVDLTADYSLQTTLWGLGDYMTLSGVKWTITQREFENYNENTLKVRYTFSKDYNASNIDIQLKRDKRLYGIPLTQFVDRYILLRKHEVENVKKVLIKCWDDFTLNQTENTSNSEAGYCLLEAVKIGNANITNKVMRCMDNYAVDIERTKYSSTIVNVYLRYCDTDGYSENVQLYTLSENAYNNYITPNISDYSRLPFIPDNANIQNAISIGYFGNFALNGIKKDKMERLIFVFREQ